MSIPGKERKFDRFVYRFSGITTLPLQWEDTTETEQLHQNYLLLGRRIGWLNLLGDTNQSKYNGMNDLG